MIALMPLSGRSMHSDGIEPHQIATDIRSRPS